MMEVARYPPPSRSFTTPVSQIHQSPPHMHQVGHQSHASSTFSAYSDSTQATTSSTLFGAPPMPSTTPVNGGGPVEATNNVLNRRADKEQSLFQICLNLRIRLMALPEVAAYLYQTEEEASQSPEEDSDPLNVLWNTFKKGYPLMAVYNALNPPNPLFIDENRVKNEKQRAKAAAFKFLQACVQELKFSQEECFIITDLYGSDTTGFVKVAKVVNRVLDVLVYNGILRPDAEESLDPGTASAVKRTQKEHIISELVNTERTYVQHLELLHAFKKLVEEKGVVTGDIVHDIFLNLNALLDVQRRFLIRVESVNAQPEHLQNWGKLFVQSKDAFQVYEPYIANQKRCEEVAMREFDRLKETGGPSEMQQMVESPTNLSSFLLKPFQRLSKYPLLLKELHNKGDYDESRKADLAEAMEAASAVLERTNAAVDLEVRQEAIEDLKSRVEDWKGHRIERFGTLLLHGTFTVLKGDGVSSSKDSEREYKIYLFEMILLCCKEINPSKQKNKLMNKPLVDKRGKPKLQLKGRIFMSNVTETISIGKPGSYTCQIFWKGDPGIENFVIKFSSEETMKKWVAQVESQRRAWHESTRASGTRHTGTSQTEFTYMQGHAPIENPYREDNDTDDDDQDTLVSAPSQYDYSSRTVSMTSNRSRSATNESGGHPRAPPPRFPMNYNNPPLTLRTQQLQHGGVMPSPDGKQGESYFSPSLDSPMSSRTSSSSGMYPFPRQHTPSNGYYGDEYSRHTTPATMVRTISREGPSGVSAQYQPPRGGRPSLPAQQTTQQQNRMRSASSPDIQNPMAKGRMPNGQPTVPDVPVPPFPTHYAYNSSIINRSHTSSPNQPPTRAATQSPTVQRERLPHTHTAPSGYDLYHDPRSIPRSSSAHQRNMTPGPADYSRAMTPVDHHASPPMGHTGNMDPPIPTQLKVKVHCPSAGSTMTLVVSTNISYQSLKDRIDAKLQRSTNVSLASGQVKLKYIDEDDFVSIQSDEDVQTAFETWKEQQRDQMMAGSLGEIELYCQ